MAQQVVWTLTIILVAFLALVFLYVALSSRKKDEYAPIQKRGYRIRTFYFVILFVGLIGAIIYTMRDLPFTKPAQAGSPVVVHAEGVQFGWILDKNQLPLDQPIDFHVTAKDVNHGFGIYNPEGRLIAQTQAMPGYTNHVYVTFDEPGTYQILCLEYCGLGHHIMIGEFEVVPGAGGGK